MPFKNDKIQDLISQGKTSKEQINKIRRKKKIRKKRKYKNKKADNLETIAVNESSKDKPDENENAVQLSQTDDELQDMDYEEAIIHDKRSYIRMYWSTLLDSQLILSTFFTDNKLNLFIIKISFFFSVFDISFFLNTLFYTDEYISDAYHNNGVLEFVSGLPKSIYSFIATLLTTNLLQMLSNSKSDLMKLVREKSNDKEYINLIKAELKKLKIKLIIYFIIIFILGIAFIYYVSAFCAVYRYSQKYWFYGCLESFVMDFLTAFVTSLFLSSLRFISIRKKIKFFLTLAEIIGFFL